MPKIYFTLLLIFAGYHLSFSQQIARNHRADTVKKIDEVTVRGYLSDQPVLSVPASVAVITPAQLQLQPNNSLVSTLNTVPGVRMEERSPGSYRLSIRGSLLRSTFGIRDVKIYYDEIPLTDAGGNTYLNAIDVNSVQGIEVLKGPDGSLFGANSGGVVLISPVNRYNDSTFASAGINTGSYGLVHENTAFQQHSGNNLLNINQAYQTYNGYRQNSGMYRNYFQAVDKWNYSPKNSIKFLGFYSDLRYETPGGLTLSQFQADPSLARTATSLYPSAITQKAAINTKFLFGGLVNEIHLTDRLRNVLSIYGGYIDFSNPFITDYENRYETTFGFRTYFELTGLPKRPVDWKLNLGIEWQQTNADINNYGNRAGVRDTAQTLDKINTNQHFIFTRYAANIYIRLHLEAALSLNFYDYEFRNVYPNDELDYTNRTFTPQLMPRIALSYQVTNNFIWRASVSRGYSTPTTAEIRPTDHTINTGLKAEYGWNYETGFRLRNYDETIFLDASVFIYKLQNAIVPIVNADGTDHYVNEGGTTQPGFELYFTAWLVRQNNVSFICGLQLNESFTLYSFTFDNTGKPLTGVPEQVIISSLQIKFPQNIYIYAEHNYTAKIPLNDANTAFAPRYNLVQAKAGWQIHLGDKTKLDIYGGVDNLLNEKYSLGNDLNAVGGRYYNAAAPRNYFVGLNVKI